MMMCCIGYINILLKVTLFYFYQVYSINSILYQRGIYPPETFEMVQKYGLTLLVTTNSELKTYLDDVMNHIKDTGDVIERWQFDLECDKTVTESSEPKQKSEQAINKEIQAVIRQITASVTFLPLIECSCAFEIMVYTDKELLVPETWGETGPAIISNSGEVKFRSFSTTIHKVDSMVSYKINPL
ncbi:hypothetical protein LSH36_6g10006 [Paralvinella palmiformis]|uniref:HORMA domain-containing protein n=1 Tax=Paralvinella palmiformis TaxID=53620 RepID=A0AAD9KDU8_9ANNE|nr:hypothetical protein LSH36_6g10006 [Paralvinella palmiformis]